MALTANFLAELERLQFQANLVVDIDGTLFSKHQVDSGLVIDSDKLGMVDTVKINGVKIELRRAETPISTAQIGILDRDGTFSTFMGASDSTLQDSNLKVYMGFITGSFDWADYALIADTSITRIRKVLNGYGISSKAPTSLIKQNLLNTLSPLNADITDSQTSLELQDATDFPTSGKIKINDEFIAYSGKSLNVLTGLGRGDLTSTAAAHLEGDQVSLVTEKDDNAMDMILDILQNDLGISASLIDTASFTTLRDNDFSGEANQVLYIYDVDDALEFIEENLLESTNTRLFDVNGKITIGLLDQAPLDFNLEEITEDHIRDNPTWNITGEKIVNKVVIKWFWDEGNQRYSRISTYTDTDSIATYGLRKTLTQTYKGIRTQAQADNRAARLLSRLSTPRATISLKTHFNKFDVNVADNVRVTHRYLPQQGAGLGFSDILEVMSKSVNSLERDPNIGFGLEFTSYTGIRLGLVSPSPALTGTITDQKTFDVPDGSCYEVGYKLRLFNNVNNVYFPDPVNTIVDITGNTITMENDWVTPLGANVSLYFADYDNSSGNQRARYAYTAPNTGVFAIDGSKAYQIIF